jgi:hypothetical protein
MGENSPNLVALSASSTIYLHNVSLMPNIFLRPETNGIFKKKSLENGKKIGCSYIKILFYFMPKNYIIT